MLKNKIIVRKIRNIVILLMAMIVMIGAYRNIGRSRAEDVIEIEAIALDNYGYLNDEEFVLEAREIEKDLYEVGLPESVNSKQVLGIHKITLQDDTLLYDVSANKENAQEGTNETENGTETENQTETTVKQENEETSEEQLLEIVDNKIILTKEQIENKPIKLDIAYNVMLLDKNENLEPENPGDAQNPDNTQQEEIKTFLMSKTEEERTQIEIKDTTQIFYNKILKYEDKENGKLVQVKGYLPADAKLQVEEVTQEQITQIFGETEINVAYDIKIIREVITQVPTDEADPNAPVEEIIETIEIKPEEFGEVCEVLITDANIQENSQVYHVKEDKTYENVIIKENTKENVSFDAHTFSIYAVGPDVEGSDEGITAGLSYNKGAGTYTGSITVTVTSSDPEYIIGYSWSTSTSPGGWIWTGNVLSVSPSNSTLGTWYLHVQTTHSTYRRGPYTIVASGGSSGGGGTTSDTSAPYWPVAVGNFSESNISNQGWTNASEKILTLHAQDNTEIYYYKWWYEYDGVASTTNTMSYYRTIARFTAEQDEIVAFRPYDAAGNYGPVERARVRIDRTNPVAGSVSMKLGSASGSAYTSGTWTNQDVYIAAVNGYDVPCEGDTSEPKAQSGHKSTTFTVKKGSTTIYSNVAGPVTLTETGEYTISSVTTTDNAGNTATNSSTWTVKIDKAAPTGTMTASPSSKSGNNYYTNASSFSSYVSSAADTGGSGLKTVVFFAWTGTSSPTTNKAITGTWDSTNSRYSANYTFSTIPHGTSGATNQGEGRYYVHAQIVDNAGNITTVGINVYYDTTSPTITATNKIGSTAYSGAWTNQNITSELTFSDNLTGIVANTLMWRQYTNGAWSGWTTISDNTSTTAHTETWSAEGDRKGQYGIKDRAGNIGYTDEFTIRIDKTEPTISVANNVAGTAYSGSWTNKDVTSVLTFSDGLSGIVANTLMWRQYTNGAWSDWATISGNTSTTTYTDTWTGEGNRKGQYGIKDQAGNVAYTSQFNVKIDKTKPTITITPATYVTNQSSITIYATVSDSLSGPDTTMTDIRAYYGVSVNDGNNWEWYDATYDSTNNRYEATISFADIPDITDGSTNNGDGNYRFLAQGYDNAGNSEHQSANIVLLDTTKPTISASPASCDWRNSAVNVTITTIDPEKNGVSSGLNNPTYEYYLSSESDSLSGGAWTAYTSGEAFSVNPGTTRGNGDYYLFVRRVKDNAGNTSRANGTATTIGSDTYQRFGPYNFDYTKPVITVSPSSCGWRNSELSVTIKATDTGGSHLKTDNSYQYFVADSATPSAAGTWINYNGTVTDDEVSETIKLNPTSSGEYYIFVKRVKDNAGNTSTTNGTAQAVAGTTYQRFGPYKFDKNRPVISISKSPNKEWYNSAVSLTIKATDTGGSHLKTDNSYQYFVADSATPSAAGTWINYNGTVTDDEVSKTVSLNPGTSGEYYVFVKRVKDNAGNTSTTNGTAQAVDGTTYQRFGPYKFDYENPTISSITASPTSKSGMTYYTTETSVTIYMTGIADTGGSGVKDVKIQAWYGTYDTEELVREMTWDAANNRYYATFTFAEIPHSTSGNVNQGEGGYHFDGYVIDNAGNTAHTSSDPKVIYDITNPTMTVSPTECEWRNTPISTTITITDPTTNAADGSVSGKTTTASAYQYYLSNRENALNGGEWKTYTSGSPIDLEPISSNANEKYYLFVKRVNDRAGNTTTSGGTEVTISGTKYQKFGPYKFDYVKPEIKYTHQSLDIDSANKTYTMTFTATDDHYSSGQFTLDDLTILMQNGQLDGSGNPIIYNLKNEPVTIGLRTEQVLDNGTLLGHKYILTISNLEQLEKKTGMTTLDYSGIITVSVPANKIIDIAGNKNDAKTITTGVDIPGGTGSGEPVDVVDPIWEQVTSTINIDNKVITVTVNGTDTYFSQSTLTSENINLIINGVKATTGEISVNLSDPIALNETRKVNGTNTTVQYGVQHTITISGFDTNIEQLKLQIPAGTLRDQHGNKNKTTEFILYNTLAWTGLEKGPTSGFLGNANIKREKIDNVTFVSGISGANETKWDASARGDNSILAWYETQANGTLKVYIGSKYIIFANRDSSYLFAHIGYGKGCNSTQPITNLNKLVTGNVSNMTGMFAFTGYRSMTSLDISSLNTKNVTSMREMFNGCGYKNMTSITFGSNFDTSKVTDMSWMFANFGYTKLANMNFPAAFTTANVTDMSYMFANYGYTAMTSLNLPSEFTTAKVTDMEYMFSNCGYTAMTSLTLGEGFYTQNVRDMNHMFSNCGYTKLASINLGTNFNTQYVKDMSGMFENFGYMKLTSLDLGDVFNTMNVTNMTDMFNGCGNREMTSLDLGQAFTTIPSMNEGFVANAGKEGSCIIHTPEAIYKNIENFKVNSAGITTSGTAPYVPEGFTHDEDTTIETGYVISDTSQNEFVWVEVPKTSIVYKTAGLNIKNFTNAELDAIEQDLQAYTSLYRSNEAYADTWSSEAQTGLTENEYYTQKKKMLKSIYKNGGFYVGKYETGTATNRGYYPDYVTVRETSETPIIQANAYPYNYVTNAQAQELSSSFATTGYTSSLMFGLQYDLVMKYLETKDATVTELKDNSTEWGNYINNAYSITNASAKYSLDDCATWSSVPYTKATGSVALLTTGASEEFAKQNIYDLAGNYQEWTLESYYDGSYKGAYRGGSMYSAGNDTSANYRVANPWNINNMDMGFRVALYKDEGTYTPDPENQPTYIPEGYTAIDGSMDEGFVIADSLGNEYVWVEVPKIAAVYKTAGLNITNFTSSEFSAIENDLKNYTSAYSMTSEGDTYLSEEENGITKAEYNTLKKKMLKSIYVNGGFYVGRYEAGIDYSEGPRTASTDALATPVIKQNAYPYGYVTSSQAQTLAKDFKSTGYESSLLFGIQWNLTLKYLEASGAATQEELKENSTNWGNHLDSTYNITNPNAKYNVYIVRTGIIRLAINTV